MMMAVSKPACARMIDGIVAVVDNRIIMGSDLHRKMVELGVPVNNKTAERQVLDLMVEDIIIAKIYTSMGYPPVSESEARAYAERAKIPIDTARGFIMKSTIMDMMVRSRVVVTPNMIKNHYETSPKYRGRDSLRFKQILVKNDEIKMMQLAEEIRLGTPFDEAAKNYADAAPAGSVDIGWLAVEDLSPEIKDHLTETKPGTVIGPVKINSDTQALYLIVEKNVKGAADFEEVKEDISKDLIKKYQQEAFDHMIRKMMTQYFIGIYY